jgi:hypothetical protein
MQMNMHITKKHQSIGLLVIALLSSIFVIQPFLGRSNVWIIITLLSLFILAITITYVIHINKDEKRFLKPVFILWIISFLWIPLPFLGSNLCDHLSEFFGILCFSCLLYLIVGKNLLHKFILIFLFGGSLLGIVFKHYHIFGAGILLTLGWALTPILYLFVFYTKIKDYDERTNGIFNFLIRIACGSILLSSLGLIFKLMHWHFGNAIMLSGIASMIICFVCFGFMMPNINFIDWSKEHKRLFIRIILIPMIYLSLILILTYVFPEVWVQIMYPRAVNNAGFDLQPYTIPLKDGL